MVEKPMPKLNEWAFETWPVHGGWRVVRARWYIDRRGEKDHEHHFYDGEVYPTEKLAQLACNGLVRRGVSAQP